MAAADWVTLPVGVGPRRLIGLPGVLGKWAEGSFGRDAGRLLLLFFVFLFLFILLSFF